MAEHCALVNYQAGELQYCVITAYLQLKEAHSDRIREAIRFKNQLLRILEEYYDNFLGDRYIWELLLKLHNLLIEMDNQQLHVSNSAI